MNKILVTGAAGFIGFHVAQNLLNKGHQVVGLDNMSDYYDVSLKQARLDKLTPTENFSFHKIDLADKATVEELFKQEAFDVVIHLAAQAGVRYSLNHPHKYMDANIIGTLNVLEGCRHTNIKHLLFASTSSVYGANTKMPFSVHDNVDHPVSLYAASKKATELMAHSYSHLYDTPVTGLRFFTVYGPWGRPDMAMFKFTKAILEDQPIDVYNHGNMLRDFTYVDDIVEGVVRMADILPVSNPDWSSENPDPGTSTAPYRIYNIGNNNPVKLMDMITVLEKAIGKEAQKNMMPIQPGDVPATYANIEDLTQACGFRPSTSIEQGIQNFVDWYREFYSC